MRSAFLDFLFGRVLRSKQGFELMDDDEEPSGAPEATSSDPKAANRARFELELEFVQSLANPFYLHSLAQQNILDQPAFVNFLRYLLYWKEKDYARFIQ
jgi:mediator of RNA polymerase II transcription subunit 31